MKRALRRWVLARGYVIEPTRRLTALALANRLREIFASYAIDTVIDVGANEGQFAEFLRADVGYGGKIESFEPVPAQARKLRVKAEADGNWSVHPRALGAAAGKSPFNVMRNSLFSTFLEPVPVNDGALNRMNTVSERIEVAVSTLDAEFAGRDLRHAYLKLDTQGYDLEVLKGATASIAQIPAVQTELSFQPIYGGMPGYAESLAAFERNGFGVADFFLVNQDERHAALEFDCLMVRRKAE